MAEEEILEHHAEKELDHKDYTEKYHVKKHRKRAKSKSIHIQHINKHTNKIRKRQTKEENREKRIRPQSRALRSWGKPLESKRP
jgi:hypothetical protein